MASTLSSKIRNNRTITDIERNQGEAILNIVAEVNPELFFDMDDFFIEDNSKKVEEVEITLDLIERIVNWDKKNKRLDDFKYRFLLDILGRKKELSEKNKRLVHQNYLTVSKYGFK